MNNEEQPKKTHTLVARLAAMRDAFAPALSDLELNQAQDIADQNPEATDQELNILLNQEFGLQTRFDAGKTREEDIDRMIEDFSELVAKWKILPMCDPLVVAGSVLHHLNGMSAVLGQYIESLHDAAKREEAGRN